MRKSPLLPAAVLAFSFLSIDLLPAQDAVTTAAWRRLQSRSAQTLGALDRAAGPMNSAPNDATEISFAEFLAPAGDGGLEFSSRLRALAGQRVRLTGCMVRLPTALNGAFVLAPQPVTIESAACAAAEIPAHAVYVRAAASQPARPVAYRPGRLAVTGVLEIGPHREAEGRIFSLRLTLDEPAPEPALAVTPSLPPSNP